MCFEVMIIIEDLKKKRKEKQSKAKKETRNLEGEGAVILNLAIAETWGRVFQTEQPVQRS